MAIELTTEQRALKTAQLAEAEAAYHSLRVSPQVRVFVDQNSERVEYFSGNSIKLQAYIIELKAALGLNTGIIGPLNVWVL